MSLLLTPGFQLMDFDKTSFKLDLYTPSGTSYACKRFSFPKSAHISEDEFTVDSPISAAFHEEGELTARPRTYSMATSYLSPQGLSYWPSSAPPTQQTFTDCEAYPLYERHTQSCEDVSAGWRALASLGLDFIAEDSAFSDFEFDWLDALDEQLLNSPIECFTELCWATTVDEEGSTPSVRSKTNRRSYARSFKFDNKPALPAFPARVVKPIKLDYPGNLESSRPFVAKITLPDEKSSDFLPSPSESFLTSSPASEQNSMHFLGIDPYDKSLRSPEHGLCFPAQSDQTLRARRLLKKQNPAPVTSADPWGRDTSQKPRLRTSRSTSALRIVTDTCTSFTGRTGKSPLAR